MKTTICTCAECGKEFSKETRYVKRGEGKFCSRTCSTTYRNNAQEEITLTCNVCKTDYTSKNKNSKYCSKTCNGRAQRLRNRTSGGNRSTLSTKINKAVETGTSQCFVCDWNDTVCDIHHIIPLSKKGNNLFDNLTVLCPNCHRKAHLNLIKDPPTVSSRCRTIFSSQ